MTEKALEKAKLALAAAVSGKSSAEVNDQLMSVAFVHTGIATAEALEKIAKLLER